MKRKRIWRNLGLLGFGAAKASRVRCTRGGEGRRPRQSAVRTQRIPELCSTGVGASRTCGLTGSTAKWGDWRSQYPRARSTWWARGWPERARRMFSTMPSAAVAGQE
jgi:hypothetical protein